MSKYNEAFPVNLLETKYLPTINGWVSVESGQPEFVAADSEHGQDLLDLAREKYGFAVCLIIQAILDGKYNAETQLVSTDQEVATK